MASVIKAGNATDGVQVTSDNTGILELKTGTGSGTTAVTVDASQNAGLGVTPSAWAGGQKALQFGIGGALFGDSSTPTAQVSSNTFFDGSNYKYIASTAASRFVQVGGEFTWNNAASGTAGNTVTFSERMRLDSSGNLGLGVTPSAWGGAGYSGRALEIGAVGNSLWGVNATNLYLMNNVYYDGAFKYASANAASRYLQQGGSHIWGTAASGTAGNAITFTQAMTLDASGNLLVGTTTATNNLRFNEKLAVVNAGSGTYTGAAFTGYSGTADANSCPLLELQRSRGTTDGSFTAVATSDRLGVVTFRGADGAAWQDAAYVIGACDGTPTSNTSVPGRLIFATTASGSPIPTERARIDSSGFTQFNSNLVMPYQGAPTSKAAAATLTGAELVTGILNTTGTTYTITLPTGTNIEGALTWSANNVCLDWYVINTASGTITIGANGNTTLGSLTIATGTSAQFRIRRTAANTFTVYRL